jgi:hypothetical protein
MDFSRSPCHSLRRTSRPADTEAAIRDTPGEGRTIEELGGQSVSVLVDAENAARSGLAAGHLADLSAWLARVCRD